MKRQHNYTIFDKEKIVAFVVLIAIVFGLGMLVGNAIGETDGNTTFWVMCKPGTDVTVRRTPDKKGMEVGRLSCGDSFRSNGKTANGFVYVDGIGEYGEGWIYCGYVATEKPEMIGERYVCVAKKRVACRRWIHGPQVSGAPWLVNGSNVDVFCIADGWAVTNKGYIQAEWLEADPV